MNDVPMPSHIPLSRWLAYGLPAGAIIVGLALWLWSRFGTGVYFDSAAAFLAGCL